MTYQRLVRPDHSQPNPMRKPLQSTAVQSPPTADPASKTQRHQDFSLIPTDSTETTVVQPKLEIAAVGSQAEQEADRVADHVIDQIHAPQPAPQVQPPDIKQVATQQPQLQADTQPPTEALEPEIARSSSQGHPLADSIRKPMEQAFRADFSQVNVHTDAESDRLNRSIHAKAFTTGHDIFFRQGNYRPNNRQGQSLIAHELTHVIQQRRSSAPVVQRAYELSNSSTRSSDIKHEEDHRAKKVEVINLQGTPLGAAANSPSVAPFGWNELWNAGHTLGNRQGHSSHYNAVRMHLWNGRLGGPGNEKWNLAPGPAKINSQMSAGPETAAKNLAEAGYKIWLRTEVKYQSNSTTATDFTAVVPHRIDMAWGVMGQSGTTWGADIPLPVAPLGTTEAQQYKDWDKTKATDLITQLQSVSDQVRAQVYDLVSHDDLKVAILKAFPSIYFSMEDRAKGEVLKNTSNVNSLATFVITYLGLTDPDSIALEVLIPLTLANDSSKLQDFFAALDSSVQRKLLIRYHNELLPYLGPIALRWSQTDFLIFGYNSLAMQKTILDSLNQSGLESLLGKESKPTIVQVLVTYAGQSATGDLDAQNTFIQSQTNIPQKWKTAYQQWIGGRKMAAAYNANRSRRTAKPTAKPKDPLSLPPAIKKTSHTIKKKVSTQSRVKKIAKKKK
ncbi:hypothetical protein LEP3755_03630 [Leptolyngbya sp. NIES-3755]|nr:hypothetical protein LEP3755_03630 [Leptolyngbya sp. NIES-3755]